MKRRSGVLPREVYKWLQSLDLSTPVKSASRDFDNGYLAAEIMSRYYPSEVCVNLYYRGSGAKQRIDNWERLRKVFRKIQLSVDDDQLQNVMSGSGNSADILIQLYTALTHKTLSSEIKLEPRLAKVLKGGNVQLVNPELLKSGSLVREVTTKQALLQEIHPSDVFSESMFSGTSLNHSQGSKQQAPDSAKHNLNHLPSQTKLGFTSSSSKSVSGGRVSTPQASLNTSIGGSQLRKNFLKA